MSRKKASKTFSPLRLGKFTFPEKTPIWKSWKNHKEIRDVEYGGLKFKALYNGYNIVVGKEISYDHQYGYLRGSPQSFAGSIDAMGGDGNSCAYQKVSPEGKDRETLIMWAWWLDNFYIPRGTVCYLTKNDGDVEAIKKVLNRRGFRTACVTKSKHTGHYPVYLLTHPGDDALRSKKNKNKVVENADVLGNSDANVSQLGDAGNPVGGDQPPAPVPDASALVAIGEGTESRVRAFYDFGHRVLVGRAKQDAPDGYGNAA